MVSGHWRLSSLKWIVCLSLLHYITRPAFPIIHLWLCRVLWRRVAFQSNDNWSSPEWKWKTLLGHHSALTHFGQFIYGNLPRWGVTLVEIEMELLPVFNWKQIEYRTRKMGDESPWVDQWHKLLAILNYTMTINYIQDATSSFLSDWLDRWTGDHLARNSLDKGEEVIASWSINSRTEWYGIHPLI